MSAALFVALPEIVNLFSQGLPIAQSLVAAAEAEFSNIKSSSLVTPAQVAADDAALDAADAALQNAKPIG